MTIGEFLNIPKKSGKISNKIKAKVRHQHAVLLNAGKPKYLIAKCTASQFQISLSSFYKIIA
jgi:hypothetical protein